MIIQKWSGGGLRVVLQHDHALLAGALAHLWGGVSYDAVMACAMHDATWRGEDASPMFDENRGRFYDFATYPCEKRGDFYTRGIDELESLCGRHVAVLTSKHLLSLMRDDAPDRFRRREQQRQQAYACNQRDLEDLRFFDALSLFICMTGPSLEERPPWLLPWMEYPNDSAQSIHMSWKGDDDLVIDPFPFSGNGTIRLNVPIRVLPMTVYPDRETMMEDFHNSVYSRMWKLRISSSDKASGCN